jgi:hypothetical protein
VGVCPQAECRTTRKLNAELDGLDPGAAVPGTVEWLFGEFFKTDRFASLAKSTQGDYRWLAKRLSGLHIGESTVGRLSCRVIRARHADALHAILFKESGHSAAILIMAKTLVEGGGCGEIGCRDAFVRKAMAVV